MRDVALIVHTYSNLDLNSIRNGFRSDRCLYEMSYNGP